MTRWLVPVALVLMLGLGITVHASALEFRVISGLDAKYLDKKLNHVAYDTILWSDYDTVLFLSYGNREFLLNIDARSGGIACRLGI